MKFLIIFFIFTNVLAGENQNCDIEPSAEATELAEVFMPKNCLNDVNYKQLNKAFSKDDERQKVCKDCYSLLATQKIPNPEHSKNFLKSSMNELRKGLSQTMFELMTLRSSLELNVSGDLIGETCNFSKRLNTPKCTANKLLMSELKSIQSNLANEFAHYIDPNNSGEGLYERQSDKSCLIPESQIIFSKNRLLENSLPDLVEALKDVSVPFDSETFKVELTKAWSNLDPKPNLEIASLWNHPLVNSLLNSPKLLKDFVRTSNKNSTLEELRSNLYSKQGAKAFEDNLSHKCESLITSIGKSFCGSEFLNDNYAVDSKSALEAVIDSPVSINEPYKDKTVLGMIEYCQDNKFKNSKSVLYSEVRDSLTDGVSPNLKEIKFSTFKGEAYKTNIGFDKELSCKIHSGKEACVPKTYPCELYNIWKTTQDPTSKSNHLLAAHDENINKILRGLIGDAPGIKEETRIILVKEGILKNETGSYAKKDAPERKADFYKSESSPTSSTAAKAIAPQLPVASKVNSRTQIDNTYVQPPMNFPSSSTAMPTQVAEAQQLNSNDETQARKKIESELSNRMMKQFVSKDQLDQMIAKAYKKDKNSQPLTQTQIAQKGHEFFEETPTSTLMGAPMQTGEAKLSQIKNQKEKEENLRYLKARYSKNAISAMSAQVKDANGNDLKVVEVQSTEELKIIIDDLKNLKGSNGEIAKLLEAKSDFILKVGETNYKVAYDKNNKILVTSPDGKAADSLTIQKIEKYLNELKGQAQKYTLKEFKSAIKNSVKQ